MVKGDVESERRECMVASIQDKAVLHNGVEMPWLGLGVFRAEEGPEVRQAVEWALELGYRSIDTASIYGNEQGVGEGIRASGVPRSEIFVTTKVWNSDQGHDLALAAFDESLRKLGLDYLDLYLIHWPVRGKFSQTWKALESLYKDGRVRAIGVSNFLVHHLDALLQETELMPMVNQVEFHPRLLQPELLNYCRENKIQLEAWSPIMKGRVTELPELVTMAKKYDKTPAQIVLRWDLEHGVVTIPKSVHKERIEENAQIFDFQLSPEDVAAIDTLDRGERLGPDPDNFDF